MYGPLVRRWFVAVAAAVLLLPVVAGAVAAGDALAARPVAPRRGIDHAVGVFPLQLLHDSCRPLASGWWWNHGQPIPFDDC